MSEWRWSRNSGLADPDLTTWVWENFDFEKFARICEMHETEFADAFGFGSTQVRADSDPDNFYLYRPSTTKDRNILAVAHLDTVARDDAHTRRAQFMQTEDGWVVYSRALDDRLGAFIILDLLPRLGIEFDVLLTVGEEKGRSTAEFFTTPVDREYNWMIEFDRGGTDVVCYQYECNDLTERIEDTGAVVETGIFSDISYLEHIGIKGMNWGVGYRDYHGPRAHAWLDDTVNMVALFLAFHADNKDTAMPHSERPALFRTDRGIGSGGYHGHGYDGLDGLDDEEDVCGIDDLDCTGEIKDTDYGMLCEFHDRMLHEDFGPEMKGAVR